MSSKYYENEKKKNNFDNFNNINFKKQKYKTPFDEEDNDSNRFSHGQNIFADQFSNKKDLKKNKMIKSDEMNPFDDDENEIKAKDIASKKGGFWSNFQKKKPENKITNNENPMLNHGQEQSLEAKFDQELEDNKKKRYIESPFEIRVEDKVESAYEYIGRKFKQGGKALKKLDKTVLNWVRPKKKEETISINSNLIAETQSNNITSFIGSNNQMGKIKLNTNRKIKLDINKMIDEIKKDKPLVKRIKTKKDMQRERQKERALNPFEEDFDLPIPAPNQYKSDTSEQKLQNYFSDNPNISNSNIQRQIPTTISLSLIHI